MRSHCAIYVDAGYLLASAATRATGTSLRKGINVDYSKLVSALIDQVEALSGLPLLRMNWYDSARDGVPDTQQERIGELPQVKLRLGRFGMDGQQKGVDVRIGLDLVNHARHRTADVFFLLSGDDDLSEAVEEAQAHGVQVVVLAVPTHAGKPHAVSRHLVRAADSVLLASASAIDGAIIKVEVASPPATSVEVEPSPDALPTAVAVPTPNDLMARPRQHVAAAPRSMIAYRSSTDGATQYAPGFEPEEDHTKAMLAVAAKVFNTFRESAAPDDLVALGLAKPSIPRDIDRALLVDLSDALGVYDLSDALRFRLRECFWDLVDGRS